MFPTRSAVFENFVNPALARPEIWRIIAGTLLALVLWIVFVALVAGLIIGALYLWSPALASSALDMLQGQETPQSVVFFLSTFLGFVAGLAIVVRVLHKRKLSSIFGPSRRILWRHYLIGLVVVAVLVTLTSIPSVFSEPAIPNLPLATWLAWLPVTLILLFIQTGTEELFFRGYLLQQFAARFESRWIWWVVPSLLFGSMHYNPVVFGPNTWLVIAAATLMGLILSDVTARSGNISLAMGMHLANNFSAVALVGLPGQLSGLSLYLSTADTSDFSAIRIGILVQISLLLVFYTTYLFFFARRVPRDLGEVAEVERVFD